MQFLKILMSKDICGKNTYTEDLEKLFVYGDDKLIKNIINNIDIRE